MLHTLICLLGALASLSLASAKNEKPRSPTKQQILDARYGRGEIADLLKKARRVAATLDEQVFGQEFVTYKVQDTLIRYLEGFGSRTKEPLHLNMVGLSGVGKTDIGKTLRKMGFPVVAVDAHRYAHDSNRFIDDMDHLMEPSIRKEKPLIVVIDEIDKVAEKNQSNNNFDLSDRAEMTKSFIGAFNKMVSEGTLDMRYGDPLQVSNVMFITTMNFSPDDFRDFAGKSFAENRDYYDFSVQDFLDFTTWIRGHRGSVHKILAKLFRTNTVGRLASNTVVMNALDWDSYRKIALQHIDETIQRYTTGNNKKRGLSVEFDPGFAEFLAHAMVYAPDAARSLQPSSSLVEQLILFGEKAHHAPASREVRPRRIRVGMNGDQSAAVLSISPQVLRRGKLGELWTFEVQAPYDAASRLFRPPPHLIVDPPKLVRATSTKQERGPTQEMIRRARFPASQSVTKGLRAGLNKVFYGQEATTAIIESDVRKYLGRGGSPVVEPLFRVLAGLTGVGKSGLVKLTSELTGVPLARVNMQAFESDDANAVRGFIETLSYKIHEAKKRSKTGKMILLLEEMDKTNELDADGKKISRPVMAALRDLLTEGVAAITSNQQYSPDIRQVSILDCLTFITMNFGAQTFGFRGDPRLTTNQDVARVNRRIRENPADIRSILMANFVPDTVNRILPQTMVVDTLGESEYERILADQVNKVIGERLIDADGMNRGQIFPLLTKRYLKYLYDESVIPSEGGRNAAISSKTLIASDLEFALDSIPQASAYATKPLVLSLDYEPEQKTVVTAIEGLPGSGLSEKRILERKVALKFPSYRETGKVDIARIYTAAHEFGHAYIGAGLGMRFKTISAVSIDRSFSGVVVLREPETHRFLFGHQVADLFMILASRAMERVVMSHRPEDPSSVTETSSGATSDHSQATQLIYNLIHNNGFDPAGGILRLNQTDRTSGNLFARPGVDQAKKFSAILGELENFLVGQLLASHAIGWYVEKVTALAQEAVINEERFYQLIERPYPGDNEVYYYRNPRLQELFGHVINEPPPELEAALQAPIGPSQTNVMENLRLATTVLLDSIRRHLHDEKDPSGCEQALVQTAAE